MVCVRLFMEFVKNKDIDRIKFAIKETNYDINTQDEVCDHILECEKML